MEAGRGMLAQTSTQNWSDWFNNEEWSSVWQRIAEAAAAARLETLRESEEF